MKKSTRKNRKHVITILFNCLAHTLALYMLYSYSCEVPHDIIYPILMRYIEKFGVSEKPLERKASVKVLGYISDSESCLDKIRDDID